MQAVAAAIKACAIKFKKEIKIKKTRKGIELTATNFTIKELKEIDTLDLIKFDPLPEESTAPESHPYTDTDMGFKIEKPPEKQ